MQKVIRGAGWLAPLLFLVIASVFSATAVKAGGLAMSGSFYRQEFEIPLGTSLSTPDIYVVVFNNSDEDFSITMSTETPAGIELALSESDFPLKAGEQKKVEIGVNVSDAAVPGSYTLKVTAEAHREGTGIQLLGSAGQTAKLTVIGEAASVQVAAVTPDGGPVSALVRLYKQSGGQSFNVGYSETGNLNVKVSPGNYLAEAYVGGSKLAEKTFSIAANETKKITLEVRTVYFEGFGITPNYNTETKQLAFAEIDYAVNNLLEPFAEAKVVLKVMEGNNALGDITLATLTPLEKGRVGLSYNYIPSDGWHKATYTFKLDLLIDDEPYVSSKEEKLEMDGGASTSAPGGINWILIGGIAGGVVILILIIVILMMRRRTYY